MSTEDQHVNGTSLASRHLYSETLPCNLGFPCGSAGKESACNVGDLGLIPGLRGSPGEGKGYPLQYSGLENSMECIIHGVTKGWTRLSDFHFHLVMGTWTSQLAQDSPGLGLMSFRPVSLFFSPTFTQSYTSLTISS